MTFSNLMYLKKWSVNYVVYQTSSSVGCHKSRQTYLYLPSQHSHKNYQWITRIFWPVFRVICCLNHKNPSRIAEARYISFQRKSILRTSVTTTIKKWRADPTNRFLVFAGQCRLFVMCKNIFLLKISNPMKFSCLMYSEKLLVSLVECAQKSARNAKVTTKSDIAP